MSIAIYYLKLLPAIRDAAKACGYAVGIHGSMERDFDLIAAPWASEAKPPAELAEAIRVAVNGHWDETSRGDDYHRRGCPGQKPHGRLVWSVHIGGGAYLDLSVMPPLGLEETVHLYVPGSGVLCGAEKYVSTDRKHVTCPCCLGRHRWRPHTPASDPASGPSETVVACTECGREYVED